MRAVVVGWKKGWTTEAQAYVAEIDHTSVWFGHLGHSEASLESVGAQRTGVVTAGLASPNQFVRRVGPRQVNENVQRYRAMGRVALDDTKHTFERPLEDFADAQLVDLLPSTAPATMHALEHPYLLVRLDRRPHYFASLPQSPTMEEFLHALMVAMGW